MGHYYHRLHNSNITKLSVAASACVVVVVDVVSVTAGCVSKPLAAAAGCSSGSAATPFDEVVTTSIGVSSPPFLKHQMSS